MPLPANNRGCFNSYTCMVGFSYCFFSISLYHLVWFLVIIGAVLAALCAAKIQNKTEAIYPPPLKIVKQNIFGLGFGRTLIIPPPPWRGWGYTRAHIYTRVYAKTNGLAE